MPRTCTSPCKHFCSYADYYEDELEPEDLGFCQLDLDKGVREQVNEDDSCESWEK